MTWSENATVTVAGEVLSPTDHAKTCRHLSEVDFNVWCFRNRIAAQRHNPRSTRWSRSICFFFGSLDPVSAFSTL